ncbi:hypothetical protein [Nocardia goodfellowii]|uniref:NUDIX hydrolase n=1 Tax=Nocardia goodfellowii TaxID=882446 RepID=A0ABS4Q9L7_9NOCA|nr:hypothetical protein [Nocardia goodfellowii]MBP2188380.1 hypothetical protein [Nocardia goodfellowii]
MTEVSLFRTGDLLNIVPPHAPTVLDGAPDNDVMVLEVLGGHLTWSVLSGQAIPAAVIDDPDSAQEWLWAVYGEPVALALAEYPGGRLTFPARPELPRLIAHAWRLGYAHWAARWWPASALDGIAALDPGLLEAEIAELTEQCEMIVDGADAGQPMTAPISANVAVRQSDYALAAGVDARGNVLMLDRGTGGWDWRGCPPGLLDASEQAVSWELARESGLTIARVSVVAAPGLTAPVPPHLRPRARIAEAAEIELELAGDAWVGQTVVAGEEPVTVDVYLPGIGIPDYEDRGGPEIRRRIREFAAARLHRAAAPGTDAFDAPLRAEIAAAASDSDF